MENKTKKKGLLDRITSSRVFRVMFSRKIIVVCAILLLIMVLIAIFAPVIAPYNPNKDDLYNVLKGCSAEHWLGTDSNGRDVLSRIIYGARISFTVGIVAVVISSVIGMALGLIAGMAGGVVDAFIMRVMDAMMAVPMLILAMFLGAILGQGLGNVCLAIGISMVPGYARVTRGQVLSVRNADYVTAGTLCGASRIRNTLVHVFPNCLSVNIVSMTASLGGAILAGRSRAPSRCRWPRLPAGAQWSAAAISTCPPSPSLPLLPALRSSSWCSASICAATLCAMPSTRSCAAHWAAAKRPSAQSAPRM